MLVNPYKSPEAEGEEERTNPTPIKRSWWWVVPAAAAVPPGVFGYEITDLAFKESRFPEAHFLMGGIPLSVAIGLAALAIRMRSARNPPDRSPATR
jgi:hypothetical protein